MITANPAPRELSEHRLARLLVWARLYLEAVLRFVGLGWSPLEKWIEPALRARLAEMRRAVALFIFMRAIAHVPERHFKRAYRPCRARRDSNIRVAIGSRLRRALRRRGFRAQIEALLAMLRDLGPAIARLVRRLKRLWVRRDGLVRAVADFTTRPMPVCAPLLGADTS